MPKVRQVYRPQFKSKDVRSKFRFFYLEKFFNKWMNKYIFEGLNYQQSHFIMKKFWSEGSIAMSKIFDEKGTLDELMTGGLIDMKENKVLFTPWTHADRYNIYDFSTKVRLINTRGVAFINSNDLEVDKEVVIIWAQKNHKSVFSSIEAKLNELIDIEMKIRCSRKAQSQPWQFVYSPEDYDIVKRMQQSMEDDEPWLFVPSNAVDKAKVLQSGAPYIVDKQEMEKEAIINEILTMMGVNNIGTTQKKEHLIVDEVNANNEDIGEQDQAFEDEISAGFDRGYKVLGYKVKVIDNNIIKEPEQPKEDKQDDSNAQD